MAGMSTSTGASPPDDSSAFVPGSLSSNASSPPSSQTSSGATVLSASGLMNSAAALSGAYNRSAISPINERKAMDKSATSLLSFAKLEPVKTDAADVDAVPTIFIRKLPRSTGVEALRSMLLFAKDLIDVDFVPPEYPEDHVYASAIARFQTPAGAHEAKDRLDGKPNAAGDTTMIVDVFQNGWASGAGSRRGTVDATSMRHNSVSAASASGSTSSSNRQSSRYNGTFSGFEKLSTPNASDGFQAGDLMAHNIQGIFSPKSPISSRTSSTKDNYTSSKAMINDDAEDDTGKILANPVEFAMNGDAKATMTGQRRPGNPSAPLSAFANLSLNTQTAAGGAYPSNRAMHRMHSPASGISPHTMPPGGGHPFNGMPVSAQGAFPGNATSFQRHNYPPVNPADQNPPCNTLYVGNLPLDTSEDELKAVFSKQRGYKRLCFRTKQNGPMCFVEFEDVSFATKALNDLYGHPLHNSVKGGIRLSFSKNPLGVRTGQTSANGGLPGQGGMGLGSIPAPPGFTNASGPPPGLGAPPGLGNVINHGGNAGPAAFGTWTSPIGFGVPPTMRQPSVSGPSGAGSNFPGMGGDYAYLMR